MSSKVQLAVQKILKDFGLDDVVGQDLTKLVYARGLVYRELPMSGCEGRIVFPFDGLRAGRGNKAVITVNSATRSKARKRFSIAHELGHYELGHGVSHFEDELSLNYYRRGYQESEANEFASELLMPTDYFLRAIAGRRFSPTLVNEVSGMFGTSLSSVLIKFVDYVPIPLRVAYLQDGKVLWHRARGGPLTGNEHSFKIATNELKVMW